MDWSYSTAGRLDYPRPIYIISSPLNSHLLFFNYMRALFTLAYGSSFFHLCMALGLFQNGQGPRGTAFIPGVRTLAPPAARQFSSAISPSKLISRGTAGAFVHLQGEEQITP